jgi:hypothetical protein
MLERSRKSHISASYVSETAQNTGCSFYCVTRQGGLIAQNACISQQTCCLAHGHVMCVLTKSAACTHRNPSDEFKFPDIGQDQFCLYINLKSNNAFLRNSLPYKNLATVQNTSISTHERRPRRLYLTTVQSRFTTKLNAACCLQWRIAISHHNPPAHCCIFPSLAQVKKFCHNRNQEFLHWSSFANCHFHFLVWRNRRPPHAQNCWPDGPRSKTLD